MKVKLKIKDATGKLLKKWWRHLPETMRERMYHNVQKAFRNQCAESEQELTRKTEDFLVRQGQLILAEIAVGMILLAGMICLWKFSPDYITLNRNSFGDGSRREEISLNKNKKKKTLTLTLQEKSPTGKELDVMYDGFFKKLEDEMRGSNKSLQKVNQPLTFPESLKGYPFEISYEPADNSYIRLDGSLGENASLKKGESLQTYITVNAVYREYSKTKVYCIRMIPAVTVSRKTVFSKAEEYLKYLEKKSRKDEIIRIPVSYKGIQISTNENNHSGILLLFIALCILIPVRRYFSLRDKGKECQDEAERDFPVIVHLLTLYMGAGLSFFSAVGRINRDYQKQQRKNQKRYAFEKIMKMEHQMRTGVSQKEACRNWGMQFEADCYQKLSLILIQSFAKGAREASAMMEETEKDAFVRRIDRAKKKGEEASTRLLFPMILLLCQVMLIVMYPAIIKFHGF